MSERSTRDAWHSAAMEFAAEADQLEKRVRSLRMAAATWGWKAAWAAHNAGESEPTRSVLLRSAAWLSLQAGSPKAALRLVKLAFEGTPPADLAAELREVEAAAKNAEGM